MAQALDVGSVEEPGVGTGPETHAFSSECEKILSTNTRLHGIFSSPICSPIGVMSS